MRFYPFEVNVPHLTYSLLGGFIVLFGMFSLLLRERLYIGEACWAFLFGIIIGPNCAGIFNPHSWAGGDEDVVNTVTLEFTRVVLAVGVFAIGVELPKAYMKRHWKSLFFLLAPVMTWGWFVSAGLIYALIPGLNFLSSLAIAACLTPTDPILAAAVVGGKYADKHVPAHIRHLLAAESGCNDEAIKDWFLILWLYQVILGVVIGASLGIGFHRHSYVAQYISLALFATGVTALLGSDDLLSSFACGTASVIDLLFNIAAFVYVGAWMPFDKFSDAELTLTVWRLVVLAICILILRRLPVVLALYKWIPDIKTFREAIFSVFISTLAAEVLRKNVEHPDEQTHLLEESIQPIVAFMVLCSILIHGLSIPSFSLGRRVHSVSRTWSRHTGVPDWTNQARMVDRGDDIIINRDDDIAEKGELTPEEGTEVASTPSGSKTPIGEEPADGNDIISEWQEGPDRVIERRAGPGEEVEVEVIRNFGSDEEKTDTFRGRKTHMEKLKLVPQIIEEDVSRFEKELEKDIIELRDKVKRAASPHSSAVVDDEDEEGDWASEPEASTSADANRKSRSKSPKVKAASPKLGGAKGRRRNSNSAKKGFLGQPRVPSGEQRGRRIDELRVDGLSRDASPARSVRFMDDESRHGSGANTPRVQVESPVSAASDPGRVTFDLPGEGSGK
ncbi:hypothetical protein BDZ89DRAFT_1103252 [Hymenopellis radicata]|nr:hypothetical protein BDZ89DRAFT_1103252 [Hymenopellis radicata]